MSKPGVMIYYETMDMMDRLSDSEVGQMTRAIISYSRYGIVPELPPALMAVWPFVRRSVDADTERYNEVISKRRYAVYCRKAKAAGETPTEYQQWKAHHMISHDDHMISHDDQLSTINYQQSTINYQQSTTNNQIPGGLGFEEFWDAYPAERRGSEAETRAAYEAACRIASPDRILQALRSWRLRERWTKEGGRYCPLAVNWLARHGWEETPPPGRNDQYARHGDHRVSDLERAAIQRALEEGDMDD